MTSVVPALMRGRPGCFTGGRQAREETLAGGSTRVVIAALLGNAAIAATKYVAAAITGSSAMFAEAVHSTVDTGNQALLLVGMHRAARPADARQPFGHGMEIHFWAFVVAILLFGLGAGRVVLRGRPQAREPRAAAATWSGTTLSSASRSSSRPAPGSWPGASSTGSAASCRCSGRSGSPRTRRSSPCSSRTRPRSPGLVAALVGIFAADRLGLALGRRRRDAGDRRDPRDRGARRSPSRPRAC